MPAQIRRGERRVATTPRRPARSPGSAARPCSPSVAVGMSAPTRAEDRLFDASRPLEVADQGVFSIPGRYVEVDKQTVMIGQMFVQYQIPKTQDASLPRGDDPRRRTDRVEFPRHTGRAPGLGRRLCRQRLCRLRRRSVGTRPVGIFRRQLRQDAKALGRERGAALHRPGTQAALAAGQPAYPMARNGDAGGCGIRRLLRQPGRDHRRRGADRADEPRSRRQAARPHRAGGLADALAGRRDRLEHCGRAAAAGERHSGDRAQWAAHPRDRRKGCAGLFRRRRGRTPLGRHPREDHIRSAGADAGRPQARAAGADRMVPGSCVAFCRPSRRGRSRTCVGFPSSSW